MRPECRQAINSAANKVLSDAELNRLEEEIISQYHQTPQELAKAERYRLAGIKAQENFLKDTAKAIHAHTDEAYKRHAILSDIGQVQAGLYGKTQALFNKLFFRAGSSEVPLEKKIEAHTTQVLAPFSRYAEMGSKNLGFTIDKQFGLDVFDEMFGKKTQNEHASSMVKQYQTTMKNLHSQAEEAGVGFNFRENRIPQPMSVEKLYATKKTDFVQSMFNLVDRSKYKNTDGSLYSDMQMSSLFGSIYDERISSKGKSIHAPFSSKVGKKREFERQIHFKDGSAHMEFMDKFGVSTNINDILTSDLRSLTKDIVIARELGANADTFVKQTIEKLISEDVKASSGYKESKGVLGSIKLDVLKKYMLNMWDVLKNGETPENAVWANRWAGTRALASSSMLGNHPIGALLEDGFISNQMLYRIGVDKEAINQITKMPFKERMDMLSDVGLFAEGVVAHGRNLMDSSDVFQAGHNLHSKMHKWSGSEYLDKRRISSHALIVYNQIGRMADKYSSFNALMNDPKLDPSVKKFFKQLDEVDFEVIKRAKPISSPDGDLLARTPSTIKEVSNDSLKDVIAPLVKEKTSYHEAELQKLEAKRQSKIDPELKSIEDKYSPKIKEATKELAKRERFLEDVEVKRTKEVVDLEKKLKSFENKISGKEERLAELIQQQKTIPQDLQQNLEKAKANGDVKTVKLIEQQINSRSELLEAKHINPLKTEIAKQKKEQTHLLNKTEKLLKKETTKGMANLERRFGTLEDRIASDVDRLDVWIKKQRAVPQNLQQNLERAISSGDKKAIKSAEKDITARAELFEAKHIAPRKAKLAELRKEQSILAEKRKYLETSDGREQYLKKANKAIAEQQEKIKELTAKFESEYTTAQNSLQNYSKSELENVQSQLNQLLERETNILKDKVANKINALVLDNLQTSVRGAMGSSLYDRQRLGLLTYKRGTIAGEALRMFLQFTTTPTGMFLNTLDLRNSAKMPKGASMALDNVGLHYVATMVSAGIGIAIIKSLLKGEDPSLSGVINEGVLNNGALIPYVNRLLELINKGDRASALGLLGATPSMVGNLTSATVGLTSNTDSSKVNATKAVRKSLPFMNIWYIKNSFDHLILNNILEGLNSGYLAKQQRKKEKHGVGLFQDLDEILPHRSPELTL